MLSATLILLLLTLLGVWMLLHHLEPERDSTSRIVARVDETLPQTQCRQCGYPGCLPYAEAIVTRGESIDLCPPGGAVVRRSLAELLGRTSDTMRRATDGTTAGQYVVVDEPRCIGCTKCIQACPVDAIVGAAKQMHTVLIDQCTGCELCLPPCPVDCIDIVPVDPDAHEWRWPLPTYGGRERRQRDTT